MPAREVIRSIRSISATSSAAAMRFRFTGSGFFASLISRSFVSGAGGGGSMTSAQRSTLNGQNPSFSFAAFTAASARR